MTAKIDAEIVSRSAPAFDLLGRTLRRYAIFIILAALIVFFHFAEPAFLRVNNLFSMLQSVAVVALLAVGVTVTLAVDGFDLSIGSIAAFTLMVSSYAMVVWQFGAATTVVFALATGAVIGAVNGLLIVALRIPDLLATLGMMFLLAGLELIPSAGRSITAGLILSDGSIAEGAFDPAFLAIRRHQLFGVARQVLNEALKENGDKFKAGYVFVAGFRPLELRGEVWADVKKAHPGIEEKALWGAVDSNTATTVASQTAAVLRAHPDITSSLLLTMNSLAA